MRHTSRSPRPDPLDASPRLPTSAPGSSPHRPSRTSAVNKSVQDPADAYAVNYFKTNPEAVLDTRPPEEKLEELDSRLTESELETTEKFTLLIHQKSLNYIIYGENSVEALRSHLALGQFYNENHRPVSALRHIQKVAQLRQTNSVDRIEEVTIAIETADAHLALRNENRAESQKHVSQAADALRPFVDEVIDDPMLRYRRDLAKARIAAARARIANAMEQYLIAADALDEANGGEATHVTAKLYVEMGDTATAGKLTEKAGEYYTRAWQIFTDLGMEESAASIQAKLPRERELGVDEDDDTI
jgi:tetratricopeptide (TPR) repeat protein